ncbi:MAG: aldo/keto reductase [Sphingomonadales bacterium]|nr:aldo/keto reductase [Sphingomonadales bacterium]MBD3773800.1 aldo/keto reductase [Paracoccaceae bacterium]
MLDNSLLTLNDGHVMPQLGFGTFQIPQAEAAASVRTALEVGYTLVDTAAIYRNEEGVGEALAGREDIFLTTKVWNDDQGYEQALAAARRSLDRLGRDHVDLLLIHWPCPEKSAFLETWKAFNDLKDSGEAKSIGVSNFRVEDLQRLRDHSGTIPAVNQIELHPGFQQRELRKLHEEMGIVTQSWSPLGQAKALDDATIRGIADELGQPASAVVIRWHMQHGLSVIPKATGREHQQDNFAALTFSLSEQQMALIDALDDPDGRIGPDPATFG